MSDEFGIATHPAAARAMFAHIRQELVVENAQPSGERQLPLAANAGTILRWPVRPDDGKYSGR